MHDKIAKIAVFYDGNYFSHVSNYYAYSHQRRARIDVDGLHTFIRRQVAIEEQLDERYCRIVDAHYFRGRRSADEANLYGERLFDSVLMRAGVITHYLPLSPRGEKGIDVWLALEAFESAVLKRYDVVALIACDGDYVPLVRKLASNGTRVLLLGWDFEYVDQNGFELKTKTSQALLEVATYPVMMSTIIDDRARRNEQLVEGLFVKRPPSRLEVPRPLNGVNGVEQPPVIEGQMFTGTIKVVQGGWGFIQPDDRGPDVYFYNADLLNRDFADLQPGERVTYALGRNDRGPCARSITVESAVQAAEPT